MEKWIEIQDANADVLINVRYIKAIAALVKRENHDGYLLTIAMVNEDKSNILSFKTEKERNKAYENIKFLLADKNESLLVFRRAEEEKTAD